MTDAFRLATWEERGGEYVRRLEKDLGLTIDQAAGLVGNLGYESAEFKKLQEMKPLVAGSRGGFGVAQWTARRRRNFEQWCSDHALFPHMDEANYGFLLHELRGEYKGFADRLRKALTIEDACRLTHKEYETPSDVLDGSYRSQAARLKLARRAYGGAGPAAAPASSDMGIPISPIEKIKAIQLVLGVEQDGQLGPISRAALNAVLQATGQQKIRI